MSTELAAIPRKRNHSYTVRGGRVFADPVLVYYPQPIGLQTASVSVRVQKEFV